MKPRKNYRMRPVKSGAKRRQKILSQKKRLEAAGHDRAVIDKMTVVEIRDSLKKAARKKGPGKNAVTKKSSVTKKAAVTRKTKKKTK